MVISGTHVEGRRTNGERFNTYNPNDSRLIDELLEYGVKIKVEKPQVPSTFSQILMSWTPMLVLIALSVYFIRKLLIYLTLSQFAAYCFCSYSETYRPLLPVGVFWLLLMASIEFYGMVNQIPIDEDYGWLFLYLGLSNLAYGGIMAVNKYQDQEID